MNKDIKADPKKLKPKHFYWTEKDGKIQRVDLRTHTAH